MTHYEIGDVVKANVYNKPVVGGITHLYDNEESAFAFRIDDAINVKKHEVQKLIKKHRSNVSISQMRQVLVSKLHILAKETKYEVTALYLVDFAFCIDVIDAKAWSRICNWIRTWKD